MSEVTKTDIYNYHTLQAILNNMQIENSVEKEKMTTISKNIDKLWSINENFEKRINDIEKKFFALVAVASLAQMIIIPILVKYLIK